MARIWASKCEDLQRGGGRRGLTTPMARSREGDRGGPSLAPSTVLAPEGRWSAASKTTRASTPKARGPSTAELDVPFCRRAGAVAEGRPPRSGRGRALCRGIRLSAGLGKCPGPLPISGAERERFSSRAERQERDCPPHPPRPRHGWCSVRVSNLRAESRPHVMGPQRRLGLPTVAADAVGPNRGTMKFLESLKASQSAAGRRVEHHHCPTGPVSIPRLGLDGPQLAEARAPHRTDPAGAALSPRDVRPAGLQPRGGRDWQWARKRVESLAVLRHQALSRVRRPVCPARAASPHESARTRPRNGSQRTRAEVPGSRW